jgi:hypothetical protein
MVTKSDWRAKKAKGRVRGGGGGGKPQGAKIASGQGIRNKARKSTAFKEVMFPRRRLIARLNRAC